jgi:hypothetical protein
MALGLALCTSALADDAAGIIAKSDTAMNQATDQTLSWEVTNQVPGQKDPRILAFEVMLKGSKQMIEFSEPADLKGTRVLTMERGKMYIYLPAYKKVRRVASHALDQGFMGTTYANFDLSVNRFGDIFTGSVTSETDEAWVLSMNPIDGAGVPYAKAEVSIRKADHLPLELKYFNDKGTHIKTETRSDYTCEGTVCNPSLLKMTDHTRNGAWTELRLKTSTIDSNLDDAIFTVRNLQQGG